MSEEERNSQFQKIAQSLQVQESAPVCNDAPVPNRIKRPVGRPRKVFPQFTLLNTSMPICGTFGSPPPASSCKQVTGKKRGSYVNWFDDEKWPLIEAAVKKHRSLSTALHYLKLAHRKPGTNSSPFDRLARSSLYTWFTRDGKLKPKYAPHVQRKKQFTPSTPHDGPLASRPDLVQDLCELLLAMRNAGQSLNAGIVQPIILGFIIARAPELLGNFKVSLHWTRGFLKKQLHWSYRCATTTCGKLPSNWESLGKLMAYRVAYLVKAYDIPTNLVVNTDQTGIHLVPMGAERTWEKKGSKDIRVVGMEDKRQVTCCVSSASDGTLLPFQVIFTGKTDRCLPKSQSGRDCLDHGFHFSMTENHWSNLKTCQQFVKCILVPYFEDIVGKMSLPKTQKMIWLIDCWSVHKSEAFLSWMKKEYPYICVLFVPANCTSKLQPADVILQRPLKCGFTNCFKQWSASSIQKQIENHVSDIQLDLGISTLREELCTWLLKTWRSLGSQKDMIVKGWGKCGLLRSFDKEFQAEAMESNADSSLFTGIDNICEIIDEEQLDLQELFEDSEVFDMMVRCIDN